MLAAGIDVFSTVNVQHLESLNDQVAELTGVRVRETFPDSVLSRRRRGRAGRRHAAGADRASPERQGLQARARARRAQRLLPHGAPRGAARGRAAPGRRGRRGQAARARARRRCATSDAVLAQAAPQAVGERLLAIVTPRGRPRSGSCGAPGARRSGSARSSTSSPCSRRARARATAPTRSTRCAASARCSARTVLVEEGDDVAEVVARIARERGTTYVLMGAPAPRRGLGRLGEPLHRAAAAARCPASTSASWPTAHGAPAEAVVSAWDVLVPLAALLIGAARQRRRAAAPPRARRRPAGAAADPLPVRRRGAPASARSRRRCGSPAPSTPSSCPPSSRASRCRSRSTRRSAALRRGLRRVRGDRAPRRRLRRPGRQPDRARPQRPPRAARSSSPRCPRRGGSSSPPRRTAATTASDRRRRLAPAQRPRRGARRAAGGAPGATVSTILASAWPCTDTIMMPY